MPNIPNSVQMHSGARYSVTGEHPFTWNINDIAHSLSNQCRFNGHCRHFYSVAEHSLLCSLLAEDLKICDPFEALMHDAHESVIGDMAAPWKPFLPDYRAAEKRAEHDLRARIGLPSDMTAECKKIDWLAVFIEAFWLVKDKGEGWEDPLKVRPEALRLAQRDGWHVTGLDPSQAKNAFLRLFHELADKRDMSPPWWTAIDHDPDYQEPYIK